MSRATTESTLFEWRQGQTRSERLCADVLQTEGYSNVDPQSPLGGSDGRKDILCEYEGRRYVAAVYFPSTRSTFGAIRTKFVDDLAGVSAHGRDAFVFLTNQRLTPGERATLVEAAAPIPANVYHLERLRSILDSPRGYGLRFEYLQIPMTVEEQHSLWSTLKDDITGRLTSQEAHLLALHRKVDEVLVRTRQLSGDAVEERSSMRSAPSVSLSQFPTADLRVGHVLWIHRLISDGTSLPTVNRGRYRSVEVWIGEPGADQGTARFTPPRPDDLQGLLEALTAEWRSKFTDIRGASRSDKVEALAKFHHGFLSIHPFLDGNGRVARALLQQQAHELTGLHVEAVFTEDAAAYFDALASADRGDFDRLVRLIGANLE